MPRPTTLRTHQIASFPAILCVLYLFSGCSSRIAEINTPWEFPPRDHALLRTISPPVVITNHSIYTSFFQLPGPLRYPYRRGFHQEEEVSWLGVFLQGRLAIVVDTEETLHVIDQWIKLRNQSRVYSKLAPAAAAQLINVIVYAAAKRLR